MARYGKNLQSDLESFAQHMYTSLGDTDKILCTHVDGSTIVRIKECVRGAACDVVDEVESVCPGLFSFYDSQDGSLVFPNAHRAHIFMKYYRRLDDADAVRVMREYVKKMFESHDNKFIACMLYDNQPVVDFEWGEHDATPAILLRMPGKLPEGIVKDTLFFNPTPSDYGLLRIRFKSRKWAKKFFEIVNEGRPK